MNTFNEPAKYKTVQTTKITCVVSRESKREREREREREQEREKEREQEREQERERERGELPVIKYFACENSNFIF